MNFFKKFNKKDEKVVTNSKEAAKERLHLVLMQDRANVSADFLDLMRQEIIEVIKSTYFGNNQNKYFFISEVFMENNKSFQDIHFYVFEDEVTEENKRLLKKVIVWLGDNCNCIDEINQSLFDQILWEDEEPVRIDDYVER